MGSEKFMTMAKDLVAKYAEAHLDLSDNAPDFDVYVVWFAYILGGMKALLSTTLYDGMYYEVTYNKATKEIYLDAYKKFENVCYKTEGE